MSMTMKNVSNGIVIAVVLLVGTYTTTELKDARRRVDALESQVSSMLASGPRRQLSFAEAGEAGGMGHQCADPSLEPPMSVTGTYKPVEYAEMQYGSATLFTDLSEKDSMMLVPSDDPFLIENHKAFECSDNAQEGCFDGYQRDVDVLPCVWHYGGCNWALYCVDSDDIGLKIIYVIDSDEGLATKLRMTYLETGGKLPNKPFQHSEVNYQVLERV